VSIATRLNRIEKLARIATRQPGHVAAEISDDELMEWLRKTEAETIAGDSVKHEDIPDWLLNNL